MTSFLSAKQIFLMLLHLMLGNIVGGVS